MRYLFLAALFLATPFAFADVPSGCTDILKKVPLGKIGEFDFRAEDQLTYDPDEEGNCDYQSGGSNQILLIAHSNKKSVEETLADVPYGYGDSSVSLLSAKRRGDQLVIRYSSEGRFEDAGNEITLTYAWDAKAAKFKMVKDETTSPAAEAEAKLLALVNAGKLAQAKKMIGKDIETNPSGNFDRAGEIANEIAKAAWKPMMAAYRKKDQAKVKEWVDFFGHEYRGKETCAFGLQGDCPELMARLDVSERESLAAIYNDFAFLLAAHGETATAEALYREVLATVPSRTVAYLNLADLLWAKGGKEEAGFYYRVYLQRMAALDSKGQITAEVKERAATPTKEAKWAEAAQLAGVEKVTIDEKSWVNFKSFSAIPGSLLAFKKRDPNLSERLWYRVKGEFALWGIPLQKDSELSFGESSHLATGTAGADFEKNGLLFKGGKPFTAGENGLRSATLAKDGDAAGLRLKGGTKVEYESSRAGPAEFTLRENQKIGMFVVAKDAPVRLSWGVFTLGEAITLRGIELPPGTRMKLEYPAAMETFTPSSEQNVSVHLPEAREFAPGFKARKVEFNPSGQIEMAMLEAKFPLDGKDCQAGASIRWLKDQKKYECRPDLNQGYWSSFSE